MLPTHVQKKKILFVYSAEYRPFLVALKKTIVESMKGKTNEFHCDFACSSGLSKELFFEASAGYHAVGISCPAAASFVCPEGITFYDAGGSLYQGKYLILTDPQHIFTVPHGDFLLRRFLSKIFQPGNFVSFPPFTWSLLDKHEDFESFAAEAETARLIAVDIETVKVKHGIDCIGFSLLCRDGRVLTGVLDCSHEAFLSRIRRILQTPAPKTFQNGVYDNQYLLRWNAPCNNWVHDTAYFFHSWYSELDKDLGSLAAFFIRDFEYWKFEGKRSTCREDRHRYNAKDCYATLCIAIAQLIEAPRWAKDNFKISFPNTFPCLYMSLHGLRVNEEIRAKVHSERADELEDAETSLKVMTSVEDFNAGSWQQVAKLFSCFNISTKTGEKELQKLGLAHPLLQRFVEKILEVREQKKAISSYLEPAMPENLIGGRLMYTVNPAGTRSSRLSSTKSSFWGGVQIQNQPPYAKQYIQADASDVGGELIIWELYEIDNEQSETRCTAYIAEDMNLIATVESGKDFHSLNAVKFFGADYEVVRIKQPDGSDHPTRFLAKKINHGVSYNMAEAMFVYTVGGKVIALMRKLLKLPAYTMAKEVASYALALFDRSYPRVRHEYQDEVKREIAFTHRLVGALGWTRWFFNDPSLTKKALNEAVAHGPQSLSVQIINQGMMRVWNELIMKGEPVRLLAQIHDSLFFQVPRGRDDLADKVQACMKNVVMVKNRALLIPTSVKRCGEFWAKAGRG